MQSVSDTVSLLTSDNKKYEVLLEVANMSDTLKNLMETLGVGSDIPLPDMDGQTLEKVIAWCQKHVNDPKEAPKDDAAANLPPGASSVATEMSQEDKEFFANMDQKLIFQIILAANYLDIKKLLDVCCRNVANSVLGKTPKQIYEQFGVLNELTPEEEAEVRKENPWLEDN